MNKRNLLIAGILVIALSITGVTMAAHGNHKPAPKRSTSLVQDTNNPGDTIAIDSTPVDTTPTTDQSATVAPTAATDSSPVSTVSPFEQFHQSVLNVVSQRAQQIAPNDSTFIDTQWRCISRYLPQDESSDYYNQRLVFFDFRDSGNGVPAYQYFDGACRVLSFFP